MRGEDVWGGMEGAPGRLLGEDTTLRVDAAEYAALRAEVADLRRVVRELQDMRRTQ